MNLTLIADQAIGESEARTSDGLGFEDYAKVLSAAAVDTPGPFTIGVFGEWGTGKTSLMHLIEKRLRHNESVVTVWFNAWRYEREEHPIVPLIGTIIQELEKHQSTGEKLGDSGRSLVRALRAIAYGFSAKSKVKVPGFAEVEASFVAKDMIDRDERLRPDPLLDRSLYYGAFSGLDAVRLQKDLRVVIMIDDLDRCFPDQAIKVLESIKLVLSQPGFIFILGVARKVIEGYLQHRYSQDYGIVDFKGELYLDKIVQLPFHLPPTRERISAFGQSLLRDQHPDTKRALEPMLPVVAEALGGNPRALIRFVNNILIDQAISAEVGLTQMHPLSIPIEYFAVSRCLEQKWPDIIEILSRLSNDIAIEISSWQRKDYVAAANAEGDLSKVAGTLLGQSDFEALLMSNHGKDWLKNRELREASISFLIDQKRVSGLDSSEAVQRWDVFASYNKADRKHVVEIVDQLSRGGLRVAFDQQILPGERWRDALNNWLDSVNAFLIFLGRNSLESRSQSEEIIRAVASNRLIIPVLLPGVDITAIPEELHDMQWVDFQDGVSEAGIRSITEAIRRVPR